VQRLQPAAWGPRQVLVACGLGLASFALTSAILIVLVTVLDIQGRTDDIGDVFDAAGAVARWTDERLRAAAAGAELPSRPHIWANIDLLRLAFFATLIHNVVLVMIVGIIAKQQGYREMWRTFGFDRFRPGHIWRPIAAMFVMYAFVIAYALVVGALGIDALRPENTIPVAVTRDGLTFALMAALACVAAPISEELFFRGLVFRGLLRWGFWPAAAVSGLIFSAIHLDLGSLFPYFVIGMILAWLYWTRGSLAEAVIFHFLFNTTSVLLLAATS
jgi:membrane protease YdiL (CAAX protease family)